MLLGFKRIKKSNFSLSNKMNEGFSQPNKMYEGPVKNTFASALKSGLPKPMVDETSPTIVIDDSCLMERDFSYSLVGNINDINALSNFIYPSQ